MVLIDGLRKFYIDWSGTELNTCVYMYLTESMQVAPKTFCSDMELNLPGIRSLQSQATFFNGTQCCVSEPLCCKVDDVAVNSQLSFSCLRTRCC